MPRPVPIPVRRKLLQRAQRGESPASLAAEFGLPARTVRHLLQRFRDRGEVAVNPDYRVPRQLPHAYTAEIREAALAQRREHPTWGAELIRVALRVRRPELASPAATTLRRWFRGAGLGPAPRGHRPSMPRSRAKRPRETWQVDASERIPPRDGEQVCWLRVVDEASGAVLRTAVTHGVPGTPTRPEHPHLLSPELPIDHFFRLGWGFMIKHKGYTAVGGSGRFVLAHHPPVSGSPAREWAASASAKFS